MEKHVRNFIVDIFLFVISSDYCLLFQSWRRLHVPTAHIYSRPKQKICPKLSHKSLVIKALKKQIVAGRKLIHFLRNFLRSVLAFAIIHRKQIRHFMNNTRSAFCASKNLDTVLCSPRPVLLANTETLMVRRTPLCRMRMATAIKKPTNFFFNFFFFDFFALLWHLIGFIEWKVWEHCGCVSAMAYRPCSSVADTFSIEMSL